MENRNLNNSPKDCVKKKHSNRFKKQDCKNEGKIQYQNETQKESTEREEQDILNLMKD